MKPFFQLLLVSPLFWGTCFASDQLDDLIKKLESTGANVTVRNGDITDLRADCGSFGDAEFELIGSVTSLKNLSLSGKTLTDEQLKRLSGLTQLESILFNNAQMSDAGFRHFAAFKNLKRLSLFHQSRDRADFNGSGLAHLKAVPKLERLTFAGATTADEYLEAVGQIRQLKDFSQWHNWESREGLRHLRKLPNLTALKLGQRLPARGRPLTPSLDDEALKIVAQFKTLERLELTEARLGVGLQELTNLPNLQTLKFKWVDTPDETQKRLQQLLPDAKIEWTPITDEERETLLKKKLKL